MAIIESPCIRNCCLNDDDICVGCYRSLAEITCWSQVDNAVKVDILVAADARRALQQVRLRQPGTLKK